MRRAAAVILGVLALACGAGIAGAHTGHEGQVAVFDRLAPEAPAIDVAVVPGTVGKLSVTASADATATVLGSAGQPLFRVGPDGVEANASAPEWYSVNEPLGIATVPATASATTEPRWVQVSTRSTWEWFDHRLHPAGADVNRWSIPLDVDGRSVTAEGHMEPRQSRLVVRVDADSVPDGLVVRAIDVPSPALMMSTTLPGPVDVLGADGEVFARFAGSTVTANRHSPTWVPTAQAANRDLLGAVIDPAAEVDLIGLGPSPELVWPEPRLLPVGAEQERRWEIPIVLTPGAPPVLVTGTTTETAIEPTADPAGQMPAPDDDGVPVGALALGIGATVLLLGGLLVTRRNR